jgi:hypothetical protein
MATFNVYGEGYGGGFTKKVGEVSSSGNIYAEGYGGGFTRKVGEVGGTSNVYLIEGCAQ